MRLQHTIPTAKQIPFRFLEHITDDFSEERIIGYGGFGVVYKGILDNGQVIAVKKIRYNGECGDAQFKNELMIHLMGVQHQNIVQLLGYCDDTRNIFTEYKGKVVSAAVEERALCLEYMPGGSLDGHLSETITGTFGYMPPEYINWHEISSKFDTFSLGVMIIQVIAGHEGYEKCADMSSQQFTKRVHKNWESRLGAAMSRHTSWQVEICTKIALRCLDDQVNRPTITEIVDELNKLMPLMYYIYGRVSILTIYVTIIDDNSMLRIISLSVYMVTGETRWGQQWRGINHCKSHSWHPRARNN